MATTSALPPAPGATSGTGSVVARLVRSLPLKWMLWWVIVPNLMAIAMWPIGGPSTAFSMALCGVAAVIASDLPWLLARRIAIVGIMAFNTLMYVAYTFNLDIVGLFHSVEFLAELDPAQSPEYVVAGLVLAASLVLAVRFAPHTSPLGNWHGRLRALALIAVLINADSIATADTRGSYKASAPAGTPIDSAILQNRVTPQGLAARNLVVIIVEALGAPGNAEDQALFDRTWGAGRWASRYQMSSGKTAYYGSTTNAELREWCGAWADQFSFDFAKAHCLPHDFARAGFETISVHAFTAGFFDRDKWYPKIGFEKRLFAKELFGLKASECGGVFVGACDKDVPPIIGDLLRADPDKRKLVYWLTLNSHLPVPADKSLGTTECKVGSAQWNRDFPMLCRSYQLQQQLADAIHAEIMKHDFPEADILIVGDHMPPFFQRTVRTRFDPAHVPWIYLKNRAARERNAD
jgi:hypothetical protein